MIDKAILNGRTDLITFYDLAHGISIGVIEIKYLDLDPQAISNARWHTMYIRALNVYVRTARPTKKLTALVTFILQVYFV